MVKGHTKGTLRSGSTGCWPGLQDQGDSMCGPRESGTLCWMHGLTATTDTMAQCQNCAMVPWQLHYTTMLQQPLGLRCDEVQHGVMREPHLMESCGTMWPWSQQRLLSSELLTLHLNHQNAECWTFLPWGLKLVEWGFLCLQAPGGGVQYKLNWEMATIHSISSNWFELS